ncbi:GSCFA domain-containing protein [Polaribacter tangerinus]|uniref:GSCFA domain-containing protein n=1 Tax=Polaribacter tangerinus TaxID=1920034 RepID=UPI000B4AD7BD|nr:GSCFA domain-containing protein [Polaribacter tangerinus]
MNLQTKISLKKETKNLIDYNAKIILLGSCFSNNIGTKLAYYKFQVTQNPFGILFHPKAIENLLDRAINKNQYTENDLVFSNGSWHCLDAHSSISSTNKKEVLKNLNTALEHTKLKVENASHIIITLGTAWVYRYIENDKIVANCHKIPQHKFSKELLSINEISESLLAILNSIRSINSKVKVLFTVSPVRHLKDGFIENTRSKAHLISATHYIIDSKKSFYFPSYEIMMDELRDYRFYNEDMIHPSETAINYIWLKFIATWFSERSIKTMDEVLKVQKAMAHKPFFEDSEEHQLFLKKIAQKKDALKLKHPFISF